ncbi:hypothetical protein GGI10_002277 [Coemansia sp. RSA 2530]|nr:hypothetical protein GGI10_002277 [Coemansia sp. RSA 2530]
MIRQRGTRSIHQQLGPSARLPLSLVADFRKLVRCHGHKLGTFSVMFDKTGQRMITGSEDFLIKIWSTETGYLINTLKGHQGFVNDMVLNNENTLLASASTDGTTRVWDLQTGEPRAVLVVNRAGRRKSINAVRFSPSPCPEIRYLATTCDDGLCRIYRWDRDQLTFDTTPFTIDGRFGARDSIKSIAFNHTGSRLALATGAGYISIYSTIAETASTNTNPITHWGVPRLLRRIAAHESNVSTLAFSSDGQMLLSGSRDGTVKVWQCGRADSRWESVAVDLKEHLPMADSVPETMIVAEDESTPLPIITPSESTVGPAPTADNEDDLLGLLNTTGERGEPPVTSTLTHLTAVAADTGEAGMAVATDNDEVMADDDIDLPQEAPVPPVPVVTAAAQVTPAVAKRVEVDQAAWVCDNSRVIASNSLGTVLVFDPYTGHVYWQRRAHSVVDVFALIPHPTDPRIAVSAGYDGRAVVWNTGTGDIVKEIRIGEEIYDGEFTQDGRYFALSCRSGAAVLCGIGSSLPYKEAQMMVEQAFPNDYTPITLNDEQLAVEEGTLIPSHLVRHGSLRDFDNREHPHQKGPDFGMSMAVKVDEMVFAREEAGRRAVLDVELRHACIDYRVAQDPLAEVRPARTSRRRGQNQEQATTLGDDVDEFFEREASVPLFIPEDDDDEEDSDVDVDDEDFDEQHSFIVGDRMLHTDLGEQTLSDDGESGAESDTDEESNFNSEDEVMEEIDPSEEVCDNDMDVDDSAEPGSGRRRKVCVADSTSSMDPTHHSTLLANDRPKPHAQDEMNRDRLPLRRAKVLPLTPMVIGLIWDRSSSAPAVSTLDALTICTVERGLPLRISVAAQDIQPTRSVARTSLGKCEGTAGAPARKPRDVSDADLHTLVGVVHGSSFGIGRLVELLRPQIAGASKALIERLIHEHAVKEKRPPATRSMCD